MHFKFCSVINIFFLQSVTISLAYVGEEVEARKGPLLQHVESTPFVPDKNVLLPPAILSPDDILNSSPMDELRMPSDQDMLPELFPEFLSGFEDNFVEVTHDWNMKSKLASSIMALFINASQQEQLINESQEARVSMLHTERRAWQNVA